MRYQGDIATAAQSRELDRRTIQQWGISSLVLMERAARGVANAVLALLEEPEGYSPTATNSIVFFSRSGEEPTPEEQKEMERLQEIYATRDRDGRRVGVLCGPGNNGGDGIAAAALLLEAGCKVRVFLVGPREKMTPDARAMEERLVQAGGTLEPFQPKDMEQLVWLSSCHCKVDALFGVGLSRPIAGEAQVAVGLLQGDAISCPVVACDIPSGLHADTGEVLGCAARAQVTVTFQFPKPGHFLGEGDERTGELQVVDIGIPMELTYGAQPPVPLFLCTGGTDATLPPRPRNSHKGTYGRVLVVAGSVGYTGAPVLAAEGALRSGAGLVSLAVPEEIYPIVAGKCSSAMPFPIREEQALLDKALSSDVLVIGPGLGREDGVQRRVLSLLEHFPGPVVLDADGINVLAGHIDRLDRRKGLTVLTPHDGEFARLTGCPLPLENRLEMARQFAREHGCILVLKGHRTLTAAPDGRVWINPTGNPGMSKGGSGDILAGILGSFLGQKHLTQRNPNPAPLVALGVLLHGAAGDRASEELGEYGMTPDDLLSHLPAVIRDQINH